MTSGRTVIRFMLGALAATMAPALAALLLLAADRGFSRNFLADTGFIFIVIASIAAVHVVCLGIPVALLFAWRKAISWWSATLAGFAVGTTSVWVISWPRSGEVSWIDGKVHADWLGFLEALVYFGVYGAIGGIAFWLVWGSSRWDISRPRTPAMRCRCS